MKKILSLLLLTLMLISVLPVLVLADVDTITYLEPVYKTAGVASSGILKWVSIETDEYSVLVSSTTNVTLNSGTYLASGTVIFSKGIKINGEVNIILGDGCVLTATGDAESVAGIEVPKNSILNIYAQKDSNVLGKLSATAKKYAAAIGGVGTSGSGTPAGIVIINSGEIHAKTTERQGAAIGGGKLGTCEKIVINGGNIYATSSSLGAGIGAGAGSTCEEIVINGGNLSVKGGARGSAIGGSYMGICNKIVINDGNINTTGGDNTEDKGGAAGIGSGALGTCSNIIINGGVISVCSLI